MDGYDEYEDLRPSKHAGVKRLSDEITCEICEGVLRDPATLPCCHTFCLACVEDKLQGHGVYEQMPAVRYAPALQGPAREPVLQRRHRADRVGAREVLGSRAREPRGTGLAGTHPARTRSRANPGDGNARAARSEHGEVPRDCPRRAPHRRRVGVPRGASRESDRRRRRRRRPPTARRARGRGAGRIRKSLIRKRRRGAETRRPPRRFPARRPFTSATATRKTPTRTRRVPKP